MEIPRSVPGLVTDRLLVMNYLDGEQITRLKSRVQGMSPAMQKKARQRILHRIADAYGQMIIGSGLFQADPHPGNIMVMQGGISAYPTLKYVIQPVCHFISCS